MSQRLLNDCVELENSIADALSTQYDLPRDTVHLILTTYRADLLTMILAIHAGTVSREEPQEKYGARVTEEGVEITRPTT